MTQLNSHLIRLAVETGVPAGKALAVDRDRFSARVTETIAAHPNIETICTEVTDLPSTTEPVILATGPLTTARLSQTLSRLIERQQLYFFDAASPIIARDSIDMSVAFMQNRYDHEHPDDTSRDRGSYINCPLTKAQYNALVEILLTAERTPLKDFEQQAPDGTVEKAHYFESCMPVEVIASRGHNTLRFGPMKPAGILNPHAPADDPYGGKCYAVVQLRQDNAEGTLFNMVGFQTNLKWGPQKQMIQMIPGLENAEIVRYGVMHRNTYLHSPEVLRPTLQLQKHPLVLVAGQLTGTEGYSESIATGILAARNAMAMARGTQATPCQVPPPETMLGSLVRYITRPEAVGKAFQPINSNWGILPPLPGASKVRPERNTQLATRAQISL
jgi:methylenetetrahydrofolate--tRNA-(uracil-5-)-methyltransferase